MARVVWLLRFLCGLQGTVIQRRLKWMSSFSSGSGSAKRCSLRLKRPKKTACIGSGPAGADDGQLPARPTFVSYMDLSNAWWPHTTRPTIISFGSSLFSTSQNERRHDHSSRVWVNVSEMLFVNRSRLILPCYLSRASCSYSSVQSPLGSSLE